MCNQLLEFKQKYGHVKVPQQCNENKKLGIWVTNRRRDYREHKRANGQKGDPERMKCLESIGLVDDILVGIHHDKVTQPKLKRLITFLPFWNLLVDSLVCTCILK
jgi:hypothetical protein